MSDFDVTFDTNDSFDVSFSKDDFGVTLNDQAFNVTYSTDGFAVTIAEESAVTGVDSFDVSFEQSAPINVDADIDGFSVSIEPNEEFTTSFSQDNFSVTFAGIGVQGPPGSGGTGPGTDSRTNMEIIRSAIFDSNTSKTSTFTSTGFPETDTFTLANNQQIVATYMFNTAGFPTRVRYAGSFISSTTGTSGQVLDHNFAFNAAGFPTTDTWTFDSTAILMFSLALEPSNGFITYNFDDSIEDTITVNNGIVTVPDSSFTINNGVVDYTGN